MRQLVNSVSGDNLVLYFSSISRLRLQQETKWVNIDFERRDLTSAQNSHPSSDDFGEAFALNLIKHIATHFSFNFFFEHKTFSCVPEKPEFKLRLPGNVSFSTWYQRWLIRQRLLISNPLPPPRPCFFPSLICSPTKQPYPKVDNSRIYRYRNGVFTSNFY